MSIVRTWSVVVLVSGSAWALTGCSSDSGSEPADPHEQVDSVDQALEAPSGTVDATNAHEVFTAEARIEDMSALFEGLALAAAGSASCSTGTTSGDVDLSCATNGEVSGSATFTADNSVSGSSVDSLVTFQFEDACAGERCVSGTAAIEAHVDGTTVSDTVAYSVDVTEDGQTRHVFFGAQASVTSESVLSRVAVFTSAGDSFVVETSVTGESIEYSIEGANGTWSCSVNGASGTCSGSTEFDF